jgi:hypothetical protein
MKNAYEIRLEVLKMAHDDLFSVYYETLNASRDKEGNYTCKDNILSLLPSTVSIKDRAEELYMFVTEK